MSDSLINNRGVLRGNNVVKFVPDRSVLKLNIGDRIELTEADFERLAAAFLADIERKFCQPRDSTASTARCRVATKGPDHG